MGLDVSHGCWRGAYSAFMRWRQELAKVARFPPLMLMEGFYDPVAFWCQVRGETVCASDPGNAAWSYAFTMAFASLPVAWDGFRNDPLTTLLNHSDSDGRIDVALCGDLADRLEDLVPLLPEGDAPGHIGNWREKTLTFVRGLRAAVEAGEDVRFY